LGVDVSTAQAVVAPIAGALAAARRAGMPIVYLTADLDRPDDGSWPEERRSRWVAAGEPKRPSDHPGRLPPGVRESDILPELAPQPDDVVVVKPRHSGFYDTDLHAILTGRGITTLVFTGGTTSICVESTLRDAFFRDYRCLLLADCTAEPIGNRLPRTNREATLLLVELVFGWVSDSAALARALSGHPVAAAAMQPTTGCESRTI